MDQWIKETAADLKQDAIAFALLRGDMAQVRADDLQAQVDSLQARLDAAEARIAILEKQDALKQSHALQAQRLAHFEAERVLQAQRIAGMAEVFKRISKAANPAPSCWGGRPAAVKEIARLVGESAPLFAKST